MRSEPHTPTKFFWEYTQRPGYFASVTHSRVLLNGDFNFPFSSSLEVKANEISELTSQFLITDIPSNFTALLDVPCSSPQISDVTFNAILIGRVNSREEVFSALQCIDACVQIHTCIAYNMEIAGSGCQCTPIMIERTEIKVRSAFRIFDREASRR